MRQLELLAGVPRLARPPMPGPCLDFEFQYPLIRYNRSKKLGVEYWALPGSNSRGAPDLKYVVDFPVFNQIGFSRRMDFGRTANRQMDFWQTEKRQGKVH